MRRYDETPLGVLLLLFGTIVAHITFDGDYLKYVKPGMFWPLLAAAAVLVAVGGVALWRGITRSAPPPGELAETAETAEAEHGTHDHSRAPGSAWLLLLPVLALGLFAPPALGAYAAARGGTALFAPTADFPALPAGDPVELDLPDYVARALYDHGRSLADRQIALVGFVTVADPGHLLLTRMIMTCCAADARPVKIALEGDLPNLAADTWLRVVGSYSPDQLTDRVNGGAIPALTVSSTQVIPEPRNPYTF